MLVFVFISARIKKARFEGGYKCGYIYKMEERLVGCSCGGERGKDGATCEDTNEKERKENEEGTNHNSPSKKVGGSKRLKVTGKGSAFPTFENFLCIKKQKVRE